MNFPKRKDILMMDKIWLKSRAKKLRHLALNTKDIVWVDDEESIKEET